MINTSYVERRQLATWQQAVAVWSAVADNSTSRTKEYTVNSRETYWPLGKHRILSVATVDEKMPPPHRLCTHS